MGAKILAVDDTLEAVELLRIMLETSGFEAATVPALNAVLRVLVAKAHKSVRRLRGSEYPHVSGSFRQSGQRHRIGRSLGGECGA